MAVPPGSPEPKPHTVQQWPRDYAVPDDDDDDLDDGRPLSTLEIKALRRGLAAAKFRRRIAVRLGAMVSFVLTIIPTIIAAWQFLTNRGQ